jgi:hypothetical protein
MPAYNPPFIKPQLLQKGVPCWLWGGLDMKRGNCSGTVADVAVATNVASVTVQINEGPIPLIGDLITVWGTASNAGVFNVTRATITAVNITMATGAGTISFALTNSNVSITADVGRFLCEIAEFGEALVNGASQAALVQAPQGDSQFSLPVAITFPSLPTTATVNLQAAIRDIAAEYTTIQLMATVAGGVQTTAPFSYVTMQRGYFYRLLNSSVTGGTSPTIIGKIG